MSGSAGGRAEQDLPRQTPRRAADPTSWLSRSRRLNRDHERRLDHHAQMVWWSAVIRLSRRLAGDAPRWPEKRPGRLLRARA
ncbi:hypothetical protein SMALB_8944 [Streptomyces malaysiensis]|uniref:Uncharacterized protein n=1 Tax=Streptomyces malaysiensis TaxID=92644 RepID=A0A7X6B2T3_STRMQ|nr:hypothetical protein [Streptomyces malaysiensis]